MPTNATKRLYTQTPDPTNEPIQTATVVIIHPGSLNLRLGRASDTYPVTIPHCIARRTTYQKTEPWINRPECQHSDVKALQKYGLKQSEEAVASRPTSTGEYRQPTSQKLIYSYNNNARGQVTEVICPQKWSDTKQTPFLIGEEALHIKPSDKFRIHWPMRRGRLNLHDGQGGTLTAVMEDLETLWSAAIQTYLDIPIKDLKIYKVLLLVPDVFVHNHVKHMTDILLNKLGFGAAIVIQESVCATFGAGVGSACVVDIGDQKVSVCCVEDGNSTLNTRITMEYGGSDVTRCFHWLLQRSGFNPKEIDLNKVTDCNIMQEMKESYCHLDQDKTGIQDHSLLIRKPQQHIVKYPVKLGDEAIIAPMSLFHPELLGIMGPQLVRTQGRFTGDPEDPHDEFYLQMTSREAKLSKKKDTTESKDNSELNVMDDSQLQTQMDDDSNDAPDTLNVTETVKSGRRGEEEETDIDTETVLQLMGIDQAILKSIERCGNDEIKKKMYSCIVVVGGGLKFEGAQQWLQYKVWVGMPPQYRLMLETMDVITRPKDMDPTFTCWKGAAVLACLDTAQELWIRQKEWKQFSVRMLRERAPFTW